MRAQRTLFWHRRPLRWLVLLGDVYCAALCLGIAARLFVGERWELIALLNSFLHLLLLPTFVWLPAALLRRRWAISLVSALPVLFFLVTYGSAFLPKSSVTTAGELPVRVLTYNLHSEQERLDPMVEVIRHADADVVAVQELSAEAAARFDQTLADLYPYRAFHTAPQEPVIGQGILSRFPIVSDTYWRNETLPVKLAHQRATLDIHGSSLVVYNTHPIHPFLKEGHIFYTALRTTEIESVLDRATQETEPVIIVGDFNMADLSEDYQRITARFADSYREAGWGLGFTFPDFGGPNAAPGRVRFLPVRPVVRLDYVFHNQWVQTQLIRVWPESGGSDHRPLLATLRLASREAGLF